ncbi:HDIG domain-containing protein [Clostridium botulinum]|uniref:Hydrolase n=1 Tax=Clostridium botulinum (strain Eklund 17B / Type B) TaxID=935198 RepID=B2TM05_CLOBB|nr:MULTISPECIES: HDIG domain-containing metalloprotein [unclassified Clostridium]ACD22545.1 putative hydrolase [Clostridium botulinum B str. Eklund 17B (NRP)]MBN1051236.1 HDIG domain-containing protein [Clostridium botulinum]MBY6976771.1 HDIG domain-containing protein [Clostridium botulinum]MBY7002264.1 HDIG domain-containing protein [Clostridium botulinum]MCR1274133.1 HDIG domain-containing protein [Clostridium botulinum]
MKSKNNKKLQKLRLKKSKYLSLFGTVFIVSYLLLLTAIAPKQFNLQEGDIARVDIKAPRDTIDQKATKEKESEAIEKVDKQYTVKNEVKVQAEDNIKSLFDEVLNLNATNMDEASKITELKKITQFKLTDNEYKDLINTPKETLIDLEGKIVNVVDSVYKKDIQENNESSLENAKKEGISAIEELNIANPLKEILVNIIKSQINPNLFYDSEKTEEMQKEAQKSTSKVIIKKNQIIIKEGEPVTAEQIAIINELGLLDNGIRGKYVYVYLSLALFLFVILFLQYSYIYLNYKDIFFNAKRLILISLINILSLILARSIGAVSAFLIPFAFGSMLLTLLLNYKISIIISIFNSVIMSALVEFDPQVMLLVFINAILGAVMLKKMQQRNELIYATLYISVVSAILTLSTGVIISSNLKEIFMVSLFSVIGGVLSGIFALGVLPFLEGTFNEVTTIKLLELSNPNNPLLKKLLMEAPGTYHHSMLVANLAEMAAEEVGANPVVARIGAYYHDVGKTERPYFFGENQIGRENPHDKISAKLSTHIIISHVKDGLRLAKEHNLPPIIQDIIAEHHGTTLVKYFYYTMKNNAENPDDIKEKDYRYSGPIPSSKEAGIVMLADGIEAAVRSIKEPNKDKIEEMVNNIIKDKLNSNQLINCDLTLKDIEKIRLCFLNALNGIYHQRIEYPKEKL